MRQQTICVLKSFNITALSSLTVQITGVLLTKQKHARLFLPESINMHLLDTSINTCLQLLCNRILYFVLCFFYSYTYIGSLTFYILRLKDKEQNFKER
jgi:hypothetical protein